MKDYVNKIPSWALAAVLTVTLPLTGTLLYREQAAITHRFTTLEKTQIEQWQKITDLMEGITQAVASQRVEVAVLKARQESAEKFQNSALQNQLDLISEVRALRKERP